MFFIYILHSASLDRFYIGYTSTSVECRLQKHLSNHSGFTAKAKDWEIVAVEEFIFETEALAREKKLKSWKSKQKIKGLIKPV